MGGESPVGETSQVGNHPYLDMGLWNWGIRGRSLLAVVNLEDGHIAQVLARVAPDNISNIFGHSLACREESEGHDFFAEYAGYVDARIHDPVDTLYGHRFRGTRKDFFAGIKWSGASLRRPTQADSTTAAFSAPKDLMVRY